MNSSGVFYRLLCATLFLPQVFHDVAYKAKDRNDLVSGIDEFLDQVTVLPPGEWDPSIRIEPPKNVPSQVGISENILLNSNILISFKFMSLNNATRRKVSNYLCYSKKAKTLIYKMFLLRPNTLRNLAF